MMGLSLVRESATGKLGHTAPLDLLAASRHILSVDRAGLEGHVVLRLVRFIRKGVISWSSNCHGIVGLASYPVSESHCCRSSAARSSYARLAKQEGGHQLKADVSFVRLQTYATDIEITN